MPLYAYLALVRRRWPLVVLLPLVVAALSLVAALNQPPSYATTAHLLLTVAAPADAPAALPAFDDNATWVTTEYLLDDLPAVLGSTLFAQDVSVLLAAEGYPLELGAIRGGLRPEVTHRSLRLTATAATPEAAAALARSAVTALEQGGLRYWGRRPEGGLLIVMLDPPGPAAPVSSLRDLVVNVGLRTALALVAGLGLALAAHALDDRLRSAQQAEAWIGARVLGVIPDDPSR